MRSIALAAALLAGTALTGAHALTISASTTAPLPVPGTATPIVLQGFAVPASNPVIGTGYTLNFFVPANQGIVRGALGGQYAIPIAGTSGGGPLYLTGDFGSALSASAGDAGNYLSTGVGTITLAFGSAQTAFLMLWGSIDDYNTAEFFNGATLVQSVGGTEVAALVGASPNGFQGFGGSAYVLFSGAAFDRIAFSSTTNSFEFAALIGSTQPFAVPVPAGLALFGMGLLGLGLLRGRRTA